MAFTGLWGRRSYSCELATETCLRGRSGPAAEKDKCGPKNGKRRGPPCVDQDTSDYGVNVSYRIVSILSRMDLIYGGFPCLLTLWPLHILIPTISFFFLPLRIIAFLRYNSHTLQFTCLKVCNPMTFSIFTDMCNHHHNQL